MKRRSIFVGVLPADSPSRLFFPLLVFLFLLASTLAPETFAKRQQSLTGAQILETEQRLSALGYWTGPVDGKTDAGLSHALIAFQKIEGRRRTGRLTIGELGALRVATKLVPRLRGFAHIEVDLTRQVMFFVDAENNVSRILPVCTGNDKPYVDQGKRQVAHTPRGSFKVLRKINGWRRSTLGLLYYPNYIHGGIAIHGSPTVYAYPASHGCIRIPMFAAKELSQLVPIGMDVIVYDS